MMQEGIHIVDIPSLVSRLMFTIIPPEYGMLAFFPRMHLFPREHSLRLCREGNRVNLNRIGVNKATNCREVTTWR